MNTQMQVWFHHVGQSNSERDFPRTIGTPRQGLRQYRYADLEKIFHDFDIKNYSYKDFETAQIWGIPIGAERVFEKISYGDYFLLLDTHNFGGGIEYYGKILYKFGGRRYSESETLWTESRFPLIFLLKGFLTHCPWEEFSHLLSYDPKWDPAGRVWRITEERIGSSSVKDAHGLINWPIFIQNRDAEKLILDLEMTMEACAI